MRFWQSAPAGRTGCPPLVRRVVLQQEGSALSGSSPLASPTRVLAAAALTGAVALGAGGCGEDQDGSGAAAEPTVVEIEFADGEVTPNGDRIEVGAGDPIDLQVTSDEPGVLHLHTDPEKELSFDEGTETFEIQVDRPGVVVVESHELDQTIVQLEVR